jgi:hypothetical protein
MSFIAHYFSAISESRECCRAGIAKTRSRQTAAITDNDPKKS